MKVKSAGRRPFLIRRSIHLFRPPLLHSTISVQPAISQKYFWLSRNQRKEEELTPQRPKQSCQWTESKKDMSQSKGSWTQDGKRLLSGGCDPKRSEMKEAGRERGRREERWEPWATKEASSFWLGLFIKAGSWRSSRSRRLGEEERGG